MADTSSRLSFILSLTDKITAPLGKVRASITDLADQGQQSIVKMGAGFAGLVGAGMAITESLEPALEVNRALGDVRALGVAEDALSSLNSKALEFSVNYGASAAEFVASSRAIEGAIKGLVGDQLASITNASGLLAKVTKADGETTGNYLGTMYNLFKTQADKMGKVQWIDRLTGQTAEAVKLFRTDGAQLKDAFKEVGAIATTAGISVAEQMAVIGSLSSTMEGGDAGGRYKAFFENLGAAAEKTGLKFTDATGNALPMLQILDKLQAKYGDLTSAAAGTKLTEAFGGEGAQVIGALAKDTDRLRHGISELGKVRGLENAERMAKAMVDPWQQFGAAVQALRIAFGQSLIPRLTPLMDRLVGIAKMLTRWTQLFPNITRAVGITVLAVIGLVAAMSALTLVVGIGKLAWLGLATVWNVLTWTGLRSIAMFVVHTAVFAAQVVAMTAFYTVLGVARAGMLLFQGAVWLLNAAMLANPVLLIVAGIVALGVAVTAAIVYWDQWTSALMNTAAFQWIAGQLQALSGWFGTIGGWTGMASAAWDGIVRIFKDAISSLVEMLNKIPGVQIDAVFGDMPKAPEIPGLEMPVPSTPAVDRALQVAKAPLTMPVSVPQAATPLVMAQAAAIAPKVMTDSLNEQPEQARQRMSAGVGSLSPQRPVSVPQGGLLRTIQNTTNQTQNKGTHVETININTAKPMTPLEVENMMAMAVSG